MRKKLLIVFILAKAFCLFGQTNEAAQLVIPIGHTANINAVDVSPDGKYYLTGSLDNTAKIWNEKGLEIRTLTGHTKTIRAVAFSPAGGTRVLTGSNDYSAILWDISGKKLGVFTEPSFRDGEITSVAFSPDGKEMLAGSQSGTLWLLDETCNPVLKFQNSAPVNAVAWSTKGTLLAACNNNTVALWSNKRANKPLLIFEGHKAPVVSAVFSASGDTVLTGSSDGTAILWKITGELIRSYKHLPALESVAIAPDGQKIATGGADGTLRIWNLQDTDAKPFKLFDRGLNGIKFTPDGQKLLSCSNKRPLAKICALNGVVVQKLKGRTSAILSMALSADGSALLVSHADSTVRRWDLASQTVQYFSYPDKVESVAFSPAYSVEASPESFMLTGCRDNLCRLQDQTGKTMGTPFSKGNRAVFSRDGKAVLTGHTNGTLQYWNVSTQQATLLKHTERSVTALAFSAQEGSQAFAIGSSDGGIVYWDSVGASPVSFKLSMPMPVLGLAFSADGQWLVCGEKGGLTEIRDIQGNLIKEYPNRQRGNESVRSVAFSPQSDIGKKAGKYVLRGSGNQVELWDYAKAKIDTFSGHTSNVVSVVFTPDGQSFFSASEDGTVKLWNLRSGKEIATLVAIDSIDWAVTTPSGLNDASANAMRLMHYTSGMDVISFRQIKERYYEPGLLAKATGFSADSIRNVTQIQGLSMFPEVSMQIEANKLMVSIKERNGGIGKLSLFINKKRVLDNINPNKLKSLPPIDLDEFSNLYRADIPNTIGLISYNGENVLRSQPYTSVYQPFGARGTDEPTPSGGMAEKNNCRTADPHIYLIVVGTSKYRDSTTNLAYPDKDAEAIAKAFSEVGAAMRPGKVHVKQLSTTPGPGVELATRASIEAAFAEVAKQATPCDVMIAYFSGHGKNWGPEGKKPNFYYLTSGISGGNIREKGVRDAHAISDSTLERWLTRIPAEKQVLILDACHSGAAAENLKGISQRNLSSNQQIALSLLNDRTGTWILTGSMADMKSYEASKFGQGLLTYSLLSGLNGPGLERKEVDVSKLFQHARREVPKLAESIGQTQTPVILGEGESFPIGLNDGSITIVLPQPKTVFIPSKFQSKRDILDHLKLGEAVNDYFYAQRLKGIQAKFVYYETSNILTQAYRVEGNYEDSGAGVTIYANLFKGNEPVGSPFELKGPKDNKQLVDMIVKEVKTRIAQEN